MYQSWKDRANIFVVYIREAHPADGWRPLRGAPTDPKSETERRKLASDCAREMGLSIPFLIDDMKNTANRAYAAWPDRLYVIGADGRVAYKGARGPWGFRPQEAVKVLRRLVKPSREKSKPSRAY